MKKLIFLFFIVFSLSACVAGGTYDYSDNENLVWKKSEVVKEFVVHGQYPEKCLLLKDKTAIVLSLDLYSIRDVGCEIKIDVIFAEEGDIVEYAKIAEGEYVFRPLIKK